MLLSTAAKIKNLQKLKNNLVISSHVNFSYFSNDITHKSIEVNYNN